MRIRLDTPYAPLGIRTVTDPSVIGGVVGSVPPPVRSSRVKDTSTGSEPPAGAPFRSISRTATSYDSCSVVTPNDGLHDLSPGPGGDHAPGERTDVRGARAVGCAVSATSAVPCAGTVTVLAFSVKAPGAAGPPVGSVAVTARFSTAAASPSLR